MIVRERKKLGRTSGDNDVEDHVNKSVRECNVGNERQDSANAGEDTRVDGEHDEAI